MRPLEKLARRAYHKELAEEVYRLYEKEKAVTAADAAEFFIPIYTILQYRDMGWIPDNIRDDVLSEVYERLYMAILNDKQRPTEATSAYFFTVIRRAMIDAANKFRIKTVRDHDYGDHPPLDQYYFGPREMEAAIVLQDLHDNLRVMILSQARFTGREYQACRYVLNRFLMDREPIKYAMETRYKIPGDRQDFFIDYIRVRLKLALLELKKDYNFSDLDTCVPAANRAYYIEEIVCSGGREDI